MRIAYFQRKPISMVSFSMEKSFAALRDELRRMGVASEVVLAPCESRGVFRRVVNILDAPRHTADVNHITGDIHYVSYLLPKRRTVLTIHDTVYETQGSAPSRFMIRWLWTKIPEKRVSVVTTVSGFSREQVLSATGCDPAKVRVVPTLISPTFRAIERPFDADRPTILHVGTTPNKNLDRLCAALEGMRCRLLVIGKLSDAQRDLLNRSSLAWENRFDLSEEQLLAAYGDSDVVAFCSTYEGFGMPIVEANTVGRAVVTSRVTSMPEVAGDAACLIDPLDVTSIRSGIRHVIDDAAYRSRLVENGYRNRLRFTPAAVAASYLAIYDELLRH